MPFIPGKPKTGGRQAGVPNRLTTAFREAGGRHRGLVFCLKGKISLPCIKEVFFGVAFDGCSPSNPYIP